MLIVAIALIVLLLAGGVENILHQRALAKIPLRILVNGTRGKTTVTRMTASMLNEAGIRTYAKTTGSDARRIFPDGSECSYRKERRPVSMLEQLPFARLAVKGKAQAIVVECMALRVENQNLMAEKLIRPNYVLMTNAYVDHVEEIGRTEEETIHVLAQSIADGSTLIAHDSRFGEYTDKLVIPCQEADMTPFAGCPFPVHEENVKLVMTLADQLAIDRAIAVRGILNAKPDIGMYKKFDVGRCRVWNAFAANDTVSFSSALSDCARQGPYMLLFNHRRDRAYRMEAFAQAIRKSNCPPGRIGVIGEDKARCAKYMQRITGIQTEVISDPSALTRELGAQEGETRILCAGNIKGEGRIYMEELIKEAQKNV